MKNAIARFSFLIVFLLNSASNYAQSGRYFQQEVAYEIDLDVRSLKDVTVDLKVNYKNNSPDQLDTLYLHLWMNAFSSKTSPYCKQILNGGDRSFYFYSPSELGGYSNIKCLIENQAVELQYSDAAKEIAFIVLKEPLSPKHSVTLQFHYGLTLPRMTGRVGWDENMSKLIHWFPRFAVYDQGGWHTMPYLSWGEFYGEYCDFGLNISAPDSLYVISANGFYNAESHTNLISLHKVIDAPLTIYKQDTWMSGSSENKDHTIGKSDKKKTPITSHYYRNDNIWQHAVNYAREVIDFFEEEIGPFPFPALTICQGPSYQGGAMEYPGMIIINGNGSKKELHYLIAHEIAHQYFYGALGFNERTEPYLDEGLATFYEDKFTRFKYGELHYNQSLPKFLRAEDNISIGQKAYIHQYKNHMHQPMDMEAPKITAINYGLNSYPKAAHMWRNIELYLGKNSFKNCIKSIYSSRRETHLNHKSIMALIRKCSGLPMDFVYAITCGERVDLSFIEKNGTQYIKSEYTTPLPVIVNANGKDTCLILRGGLCPLGEDIKNSPLEIDPYYLYNDPKRSDNTRLVKKPVKLNLLGKVDNPNILEFNILPSIHYNTSNRLSPGMVLYNSTFPSQSLRWMVNPGYSFKSEKFIGQSWIEYDWRIFRNKSKWITPYISFKSYAFQYSNKFDYNLSYLRSKIGITYNVANPNTPKIVRALNFNWTRVNEERAFFNGPDDYQINGIELNRYQLRLSNKNNNALTPHTFDVNIDYVPEYNQNENFINLSTTFTQKFYYSSFKSFDVRIWASYFLINTQRRSLSYNNQLVRGSAGLYYQSSNDFMYDNYYLDRDDGSANQSFSNLGGGFKTTFNNNSSLGQSNDLAFAINLKTDLPFKTLEVLPLKLFYDIGGYTTFSQNLREYNYLYSGGVSFTAMNGAIEANLPLINSKEINQIFREEGGSFFRRISFNIDLLKLNPWNILKEINYLF